MNVLLTQIEDLKQRLVKHQSSHVECWKHPGMSIDQAEKNRARYIDKVERSIAERTALAKSRGLI